MKDKHLHLLSNKQCTVLISDWLAGVLFKLYIRRLQVGLQFNHISKSVSKVYEIVGHEMLNAVLPVNLKVEPT